MKRSLLLSFKKKKKSHFAFIKEEKALIHQTTQNDTKASCLLLLPLIMLLGVRTRAQKRRIGVRDLWDLIVNNDDILFQTYPSEIEWTDLKILVRGEYGDEKVDKEINSRG